VGKACNLALTYAREEVPAESGAVILQEGSYLRFAAVVGPVARRLRGARLPLGAGVAGYALETRREVVLLDARRDPRHCGEVDALTGYVTRQILVVPVIHGRKALGVIELMNRQRGDAFSSEDAQLVAGIARVLAERLAR
jgi:GAF domain-containing protein